MAIWLVRPQLVSQPSTMPWCVAASIAAGSPSSQPSAGKWKSWAACREALYPQKGIKYRYLLKCMVSKALLLAIDASDVAGPKAFTRNLLGKAEKKAWPLLDVGIEGNQKRCPSLSGCSLQLWAQLFQAWLCVLCMMRLVPSPADSRGARMKRSHCTVWLYQPPSSLQGIRLHA